MNKATWHKTVREGCKQKERNNDSSAYCVYCRKKGRQGNCCTFESCPIKVKEK